jgi:alpha-galactosidase
MHFQDIYARSNRKKRIRRIDIVSKRPRRRVSRVGLWIIASTLLVPLSSAAQQLTNGKLSLSVNLRAGSYQLAVHDGQPVLSARVGAQVDHQWLRSSDYPRCQAAASTFSDGLGPGRQLTVTCSELEGNPDLVYIVQLYDRAPYGTIQVKVHNSTGKPVAIQAIRSVEAIGQPLVNLGGRASADRILSDSFSEDWPDLKIFDLGTAAGGMHRGVGSQLIYNRESKQSLFLGALTSERFLTLMYLSAEDKGAETKIASYAVESSGTTEIQKDFGLKDSPLTTRWH